MMVCQIIAEPYVKCEEYATKYLNFRVIHQDNQGQAVARNNAVQIASGNFILFIDSDNWVEHDYVEYLITLQRQYDADIVIGGVKCLYEGKTPFARNDKECIDVMKCARSFNSDELREWFWFDCLAQILQTGTDSCPSVSCRTNL